MLYSKAILVLSVFGLSTQVFAKKAADPMVECHRAMADIVKTKILQPNRGLHIDAERGSADPYWNRLSQVLRASDAEDLEKLFYPSNTKLDAPEVFDGLFWKIKSGEIKADGRMDRLVTELRDFVVENASSFRHKKDRGYYILKALELADKYHNFSGDPTLAARNTMRALAIAEESLLARALAESTRGKRYPNSKWYDWIHRFFSPHWKRMQRIIEFNNAIRARMQQDYLADEPIVDTLLRYEKEITDPKDLSALRKLVADTPAKLKEAREIVEKAYKRELSYTDPLREADQRLADLDKKMNTLDADKEFEESIRESEHDMDVLDRVHASYRKKKKLGPRPFDDYHDVHLRIRQNQYERETRELHSSYENVLERNPRDPNYNVNARWTVTEVYTKMETEHYTDSNGKRRSRAIPKLRPNFPMYPVPMAA
jgi:hypothetical protein